MEWWIKIKAWVKKYWWILAAVVVSILAFVFVSGDSGKLHRTLTRVWQKQEEAKEKRDGELKKLQEEKDRKIAKILKDKEKKLEDIEATYGYELKELKKENEERYNELVADPDLLLDVLRKRLR